MRVNENPDSTHIYGDKHLNVSVQTYDASGPDACLLLAANKAGISCTLDVSADEADALAAALTRHAQALRAAKAQPIAEAA
jgi:hypothetical protein